MSRTAIKYQSYFISSQSRGRSTFGRLIFSSHRSSPSLFLSLASFSSALSHLSRFVLLSFSRVSFLIIYIWFCGSMLRARAYRNKVSIIPPHLLDRRGRPTNPLRSGMLRTAWRPSVFRLANMKSASSLVTHFPNSRIVLHPRARTK